jgi:DNA-directed RNA polymerase specialized sigma24 family protein
VRESPEVIELADARPVEVDETTGPAAAFACLADDHLDAGYRLARAILSDPKEAQDATHDALLQAWRRGRPCGTTRISRLIWWSGP